jgi:hypothetical protein
VIVWLVFGLLVPVPLRSVAGRSAANYGASSLAGICRSGSEVPKKADGMRVFVDFTESAGGGRWFLKWRVFIPFPKNGLMTGSGLECEHGSEFQTHIRRPVHDCQSPPMLALRSDGLGATPHHHHGPDCGHRPALDVVSLPSV